MEALHLLGDPVLIPTAVINEIQQRGSSDPAVQVLGQTNWLQSVDPGGPPPVLASWPLGPGETAVLTHAIANPETEVIVDDRTARKCATALAVPKRGTVALILLAKQQALIPLARPVLEELRKHGMFLSDRAMNQALALVGE